MLALTCVPLAWATTSAQHEQKAKQLEQSASAKQAEADEVKKSIDELQTRINALTAEYNDALAAHDAATAAVEDAKLRVKAAEDKIGSLQDQLGDRAISMYKTGGSSSLFDVVLGASSFDSFLKSWDAFERIADQDAKLIQEMKDARAEAEAAKAEGERQQKIAQDKMREAEEAKAGVEATKASMQSTLSRMNEEIATLNERIEEEEMAAEQAKKLEEEAARLAQEAFKGGGGQQFSSVAANAGGWVHPHPGSRVTSEFGTRVHPISGVVRFHAGIDLSGAHGSPIFAAKAGTVTYKGWYGGGGNTVIVSHGNGIRTLYEHMSGFNCSIGDSVQAGQCIGYVGSTGNSTGPHLHFGLQVNGVDVNPRSILKF